jgi:hypothetical protein
MDSRLVSRIALTLEEWDIYLEHYWDYQAEKFDWSAVIQKVSDTVGESYAEGIQELIDSN